MNYVPGHKFKLEDKGNNNPSITQVKRKLPVIKPFVEGETYTIVYINVLRNGDENKYEYQFSDSTGEIVKVIYSSIEEAENIIQRFS